MTSEWLIFGVGVAMMFTAYFIRRSGRRALDEARVARDDDDRKEPKVAKPAKKKPSKKADETSDFKGFHWQWSIREQGSHGPLPHGDDTLTQVFLQEIRDEARLHANQQRNATNELTEELRTFNKMMRQLFGTDDEVS